MSEIGLYVGGKLGPLRIQFKLIEIEFWLLGVNLRPLRVDVRHMIVDL